MEFEPQRTYAIWHDRATFHFLNLAGEIQRYVIMAQQFTDGHLIMATFSPTGPEKCSGLPVSRYDEKGLQEIFKNGFTQLASRKHEHLTPMHSRQDFLFCSFIKDKNQLDQNKKTNRLLPRLSCFLSKGLYGPASYNFKNEFNKNTYSPLI